MEIGCNSGLNRQRHHMNRTPSRPTTSGLRETALKYLERYSATEAGLRRLLERRIIKWQLIEGASDTTDVADLRNAIDDIVASFWRLGLLDDKAFAESKGDSLRRAGRSTRAARAQLVAKGVDSVLADQVLPDDLDAELAAALITTRRRRIGPFGEPKARADASYQRDLAKLVRAGFSIAIAEKALATESETAETIIREARR
jgi:regulatory protein